MDENGVPQTAAELAGAFPNLGKVEIAPAVNEVIAWLSLMPGVSYVEQENRLDEATCSIRLDDGRTVYATLR